MAVSATCSTSQAKMGCFDGTRCPNLRSRARRWTLSRPFVSLTPFSTAPLLWDSWGCGSSSRADIPSLSSTRVRNARIAFSLSTFRISLFLNPKRRIPSTARSAAAPSSRRVLLLGTTHAWIALLWRSFSTRIVMTSSSSCLLRKQ